MIQSDLYAVGPTLIFLLTGQNPGNFIQHGRRGSYFDVKNVPTITPKLRQIIERVTEILPRDRFQSAKELAGSLMTCL